MKFIPVGLLIFFICFKPSLHSQRDTVSLLPEDILVDGSNIHAYTNRWKLFFVDLKKGDTIPNGIWTDYLHLLSKDGKQTIHRVQDMYAETGDHQETWINVVDSKSMVPKRFSRFSPAGNFTLYNFNGTEVSITTNTIKENGEISEEVVELKERVFDWNLYGILIAALPLKKGLIFKMPFFQSSNNSRQNLILNVVEKEVLHLNSKDYETWKVWTNQNLIFWISKKAPYVIKLELNGFTNGRKLVWEVF